MATIAIKNAQLAGSIAASKLAGSVPDSKLSQISTAGKVALSALEIDGGTDIGAALADADLIIVDDGAGGTNRKSAVSRIPTYVFGKVSGDATIADGGALTIANDAVEQAMIADDAVGADQLAANAVVNASIASNAAIDMDKLDGGSLASSLSDLAQGDLMYAGDVDDSNNLKSITFSNLEDAIFGNISGDATIAAGGALTIANDAVEQAMIADDAVGADQLAANAVVFASVASNAYSTDLGSSASSSEFARADAIKAYVDSQIAGLDVKASVVAATTASFTMASTASTSTIVLADGEGGFSASANTLTIDGVSVGSTKRVLIKDGVNSNGAGVHNKWNGVYTVGSLTGSTCTLTRATDFDAASEFVGAPFFMVEGGTDNGAHGFVSQVNTSITIGTDAITFYQFSAPGQDAVAGGGLAMSGNVLSVDVDELSALGSATLHQTQDHFLFSDNGTEKKVSFSNLEDSIFGNVSGDATIAAGGALTIANDAVEQAMIADDAVGADQLAASAVVNASVVDGSLKADKLDIDGSTDIGADLVDADLLIVDDGAGGTNRKSTLTRIKKYIWSSASGDATASDSGALTIANDAVEQAMIADDAVGADQLASSAVVTASIVDDAVTAAKLQATIKQQTFTVADSSTTNFDLAVTLDASHNKPLVYRNGLALVPSSDSDNDSYTVSLTGGSGGVTRVSLGANAENGDIVMIVFIS